MNIRKTASILTAMVIAVGLLGGCSSNEKKDVTVINLPTASTTGALYPLGAAMATLWNEKLDNVRVNAQASNGGIDNLNFIQKGDAQMSMGVTSIVYQSYHGEDKFKGRPNKKLRVVAGLYYNPNQVVVRADSGINSLKDLKGKKFASGAPGSTTEVETKHHLEAVGLKYPDDINAQFVGFTESSDLMRNNQLYGAWIMAGVPTAAVTEITTTAYGKLIPIDKSVVAKLKEKYPWYTDYTIPNGTYKNQNEDINTSAIKMVLYTTEDIPEDVIYNMTKVFWENIDQLKKSNPSLKTVTIENTLKDISGLPVHKGAQKYYDEVLKK